MRLRFFALNSAGRCVCPAVALVLLPCYFLQFCLPWGVRCYLWAIIVALGGIHCRGGPSLSLVCWSATFGALSEGAWRGRSRDGAAPPTIPVRVNAAVNRREWNCPSSRAATVSPLGHWFPAPPPICCLSWLMHSRVVLFTRALSLLETVAVILPDARPLRVSGVALS